MKFWLKSVIVPPGTTFPTVRLKLSSQLPSFDTMWIVKSRTVPQATVLSTWKAKWFDIEPPVPSAAMFGKDAVASVTVTPVVELLNVPTTLVTVEVPLL